MEEGRLGGQMEKPDRRHSDPSYQRELEKLLDRVLFMGARVESRFMDALRSYVKGNVELARALLVDEADIRDLEDEIDAACVDILSRHQAMASDLRFITMTFKLARDLQRIGGLSMGICRRTLQSDLRSWSQPWAGLEEMGELARDMLHRALDAYVAKDAILAGEVVTWDRQLDEQYGALWSRATAEMSSSPAAAAAQMRFLAVAKAVERIADHAVSVSEMVVFMVEGTADRPRISRVLPAVRQLG
jgi:phosphate transport system protein